ncbi:MAG: integral rane sensor signal transduction histidine kinase, partial [Alphaproteobacteria bacterium]|nr:integral rane sensor signal transduction histidine kinase [Alphaproteobacteria bacterium]
VKRCLQSLNYDITQAKAEIITGELPSIYADELAIEQIFSNVIENAVKYLDPQRPGEIEIAGTAYHDEVIYAIRDTGRGIKPQDADKVFDIFRRARNTGNVRGNGMGLAFVKATIRKMGGRIWYDSEYDKGTIFYISLPRQMKEEQSDDL